VASKYKAGKSKLQPQPQRLATCDMQLEAMCAWKHECVHARDKSDACMFNHHTRDEGHIIRKGEPLPLNLCHFENPEEGKRCRNHGRCTFSHLLGHVATGMAKAAKAKAAGESSPQ
jgi:hypothetical protein